MLDFTNMAHRSYPIVIQLKLGIDELNHIGDIFVLKRYFLHIVRTISVIDNNIIPPIPLGLLWKVKATVSKGTIDSADKLTNSTSKLKFGLIANITVSSMGVLVIV